VVVPPRRYATLDEVLARAIERGEPPFVLALDSLEDPQNVGTLLRSAEAAAIHGVLFPTHRQAPLTPAAVKASAGAVEHLLLCPVADLAGGLADLHARGLRVVGAEAGAPMTAREADMRGPLAIVIGSEGQGLGPAVRNRCDVLVRIPLRGAIESLNAAVAGSILLFEADAQRHGPEAETEPKADRKNARDVDLVVERPPKKRRTRSAPDAGPPVDDPPKKRRARNAKAAPADEARAVETEQAKLLPGGPDEGSAGSSAPKRRRKQA
jgi:predicted rRNA methylase